MNADDELLERLADVLDRVDPMPPDLITTGRAVFKASPTNPSAGAGVPPCSAPAEAKMPAPPAGCNEAAGGADNQIRRWAITALKVIAIFAGLAGLIVLGFAIAIVGVGLGVLGTPA